jgi:hypothetical protein
VYVGSFLLFPLALRRYAGGNGADDALAVLLAALTGLLAHLKLRAEKLKGK